MYWNFAMKDYKEFRKFNSIANTLTNSRSNMSPLDEATLRHVHIQSRNTTKKTMTCNF